MPLSLRMQLNEITLSEKKGVSEAEGVPIGKIELDFELNPLVLIEEEDRHRLLVALAQLYADSGVPESQVDLIIPELWGVTHSVPDPTLSDEDLQEHLQWELSKALIDSKDNYRFNFAFSADDKIIVAALRLRLLNSLEEVAQKAGFKLSGLFLAGDPWEGINLLESPERSLPGPEKRTPERKTPARRAKKSKPIPKDRARGSRPSWFVGILLLVALVVAIYFVWLKLTPPPGQEGFPEPVTHLEEQTQAETPPDIAQHIAETPAEATQDDVLTASPWAVMSKRMELVSEMFMTINAGGKLDLISFTGDRFLCQLANGEELRLQEALEHIAKGGSLKEAKTQKVPPYDGLVHGIVSGRLVSESGDASITPVKADIIALGKKLGLKNEELIFTGAESSVMQFLGDIALKKYAIYRFILVPWGEDQYRTVLEL
ncbi:hypothetical protein CEE37_05405 [candidate division LCP-89 bacterium B3_LCP]|uniref:Uncharacterized protein n=1 Tax=candidate division LCP-89 bacterium B3_LCP TaxID=2012998 RepID=A0A532V1N2_UNCL8|nr:MAG: hypothetical protein CEE37_05405 [candidate division LCP-89 bacterium B3_LCP]